MDRNHSMSTPSDPYLSETEASFPNFTLRAEVATCFIEYNGKVLVLKSSENANQPFTWGTPGGKKEPLDHSIRQTLTRELFEELHFQTQENDYKFVAKRYARIPGWDYTLHVFHLPVKQQPKVDLSHEHVEAKWISLQSFTSLKLLKKGQDEAFRLVYGNRYA